MDNNEDFFSLYGDTGKLSIEELEEQIEEINLDDFGEADAESTRRFNFDNNETEIKKEKKKEKKKDKKAKAPKAKKGPKPKKEKEPKPEKDKDDSFKKRYEQSKLRREARHSGLYTVDKNGEKIVLDEEPSAFPIKKLHLYIVGIVAVVALFISMIVIGVTTFVNADKTVSIQSDHEINSRYPINFVSRIKDVAANRNGVAVLNGANISFFDSSARQIDDVHLNYTNPYMVKCDKYVLVYDAGGINFRIFGSKGEVLRGTSFEDKSIVGASVSDTGAFMLFTRPRQTSNSVSYVQFYQTFTTTQPLVWGCSDYIIDGAISPNAKQIMFACMNTSLVKLYTKVYVLKITDLLNEVKEADLWDTYETVPVSCHFPTNNRIIVNFKDLRYIYLRATNNNKPITIEYPGELLMQATDKNGNTVAVTRTENLRKVRLTIYNNRNVVEYTKDISNDINDISISGKNVYVLTDKKLMLVRPDKDNETLEKYDILRNKLEIYGKEVYNYSSDRLFRY